MDDFTITFRILDNILNDPELGSKKNITRFLNHSHTLNRFRIKKSMTLIYVNDKDLGHGPLTR